MFESEGRGIEAIALSPEGRHVVTGNADGSIAIVRVAQKQVH
jgi:hypothetical protein